MAQAFPGSFQTIFQSFFFTSSGKKSTRGVFRGKGVRKDQTFQNHNFINNAQLTFKGRTLLNLFFFETLKTLRCLMQLWRDRRASRIELGKKSIMEKISHLKMPHLPRVDEWRTVAQVPQQLRQTSPWSLPLGGSQVMCYKKYIIMLIFFSFNWWILVKSSSPFDISFPS